MTYLLVLRKLAGSAWRFLGPFGVLLVLALGVVVITRLQLASARDDATALRSTLTSVTAERDLWKGANESTTRAANGWRSIADTLQGDIAAAAAERERVATANAKALASAKADAERARRQYNPPVLGDKCKATMATLNRVCPELGRY